MTLKEKIGQLLMLDGRGEGYADAIREMSPGAMLHILPPKSDHAIELSCQSRLGIPLLIAEGQRIVEPGTFEVQMGSSSRLKDLLNASLQMCG